jgi:hypothetical protein
MGPSADRCAAWRICWSSSLHIKRLREGDPAEEIVALAEGLDADLVVVGSRGSGLVGRLITGSVSEAVVRRAPCPVLVVRGGEGSWPIKRIVVGEDGSGPAMRAGGLAAERDEGRTLLAVGSRGLGTLERALSGSVSTRVLRAARGPVLVVPSEKKASAW